MQSITNAFAELMASKFLIFFLFYAILVCRGFVMVTLTFILTETNSE